MNKLLLLLLISSQIVFSGEFPLTGQATIKPHDFMKLSLPKIWHKASLKEGSPIPHGSSLFSLIDSFETNMYENQKIEEYYERVNKKIGLKQRDLRNSILKGIIVPRSYLQNADHVSLENLRFILHDKVLKKIEEGFDYQVKDQKVKWTFKLTENDLKRIFPLKKEKENQSL